MFAERDGLAKKNLRFRGSAYLRSVEMPVGDKLVRR